MLYVVFSIYLLSQSLTQRTHSYHSLAIISIERFTTSSSRLRHRPTRRSNTGACGGGDTRICENTDNGVKNSLGYSCVDVAIGHNYGYNYCKSNFDTATFTASDMCCACGGGQTVLLSSDTCEQTSGDHVDIEGDACAHYRKYHLGTGCDGRYDTEYFTASEMCCGCGGSAPSPTTTTTATVAPTTTTTVAPTATTEAPAPTPICFNTMFEARDSRGKHCGNGQYIGGNICGLYDNSQFTANQMCCQCGGGFTWVLGSFDQGWDASAEYCYDDTGNGQLHSLGGTCGFYVLYGESTCSLRDDGDFTASEMCCTWCSLMLERISLSLTQLTHSCHLHNVSSLYIVLTHSESYQSSVFTFFYSTPYTDTTREYRCLRRWRHENLREHGQRSQEQIRAILC